MGFVSPETRHVLLDGSFQQWPRRNPKTSHPTAVHQCPGEFLVEGGWVGSTPPPWEPTTFIFRGKKQKLVITVTHILDGL